jgi:putative ABC transport system permease protein
MFSNDRDAMRRQYLEAWRKYRSGETMTPLEAMIGEVVAEHPEYHHLLEDSDAALGTDWTPEGGATNPFLHMGLHLALREQVATDRPPGVQAVHTALARRLPEGLRLESAAGRNRQAREMTSAFRANLTAMSLLAVVVGVFLIYNTMTFTVVQRRPLIGTLRALGATRGMIFNQVVLETLALGALGTAAGMLAGVGLAHWLVHLVTRTINDLYFVLTVRELFISPGVLAKGAVIGLGASLAAALGPAWEAAGSPPDTAGRRSVLESRARSLVPWLAGAGLVLLAVAGGLLWLPGGGLAAGFGALLALILGVAGIIPLALQRLVPPLAALSGSLVGPLGRLAANGIALALSRTGLAVIALAVALSAGVGVGIMIDSFRGTVERWLDRSLVADLYVSGPDRVSARHFAPLPEALPGRVRGMDGVAAVDTRWRVEVQSPVGPVPLLALDPAPGSLRAYRLKLGDPERAWRRFRKGEAVMVTEPFATRRGIGPGATVTLATADGERSFPVAGVYFDYNTDRGMLLMHRDLFDRWWPGGAVSSVGIFLAEGAEPDRVAQRVRSAIAATGPARLRSSAEIRRLSLEVFDRTFAITSVLRLLALGVAFVGVLTALLALQLERAREFAILRATGATPGQVRGLLFGQNALLGLIAGLFALPLGLAMAEVLIHVINQRAFGWSITSQIAPGVIAEAMILATGASLLAGAWPAWRAGHTDPAAALREE